jgi:hypothetical protein
MLQHRIMENQNILVCFSVVHVLLNIYTSTCQGKVFSREINHNDQTIVIDIRDHFIDVLNSMLIIQYKFQYQNYMYPVQKRASGHIFFCERNNTSVYQIKNHC